MIKRKSELILKTVSVTALAVLILIYSRETAKSAVNSINVCLETIIPSMFILMVLSTYIQSSGIYKYVFYPVMGIMKKVLKADDSIISVFLLSLIGGYPVGIKLLKELIAQNNNYHEIREVCSRSAAFCYCISPSFALIMLGNGVFGSTSAGMIIYLSDVAAAVITGAIVSRIHDLKTDITYSTANSSASLTSAVNSASRALFTVCSVIIVFNTFLAAIDALLKNFGIVSPSLISGMLEISNLLKISHSDVSMIPLVTGISSFGGLCVLLQCYSIVDNAFSVKYFLIARLPCTILSAVISYFLTGFVDISVSASTYSADYSYEFSTNKIIVLVLIAMCIIIFHRSDKILKKV